jgi:BirA family biotin operon repressor/biotin-[acetyl-CoA-carboxylase] ligase
MARYICLDTIDSTSLYIKRELDNLSNLSFVRAKKQTNGKGRGNHVWESDDNNLLFSFLIKDKSIIERFPDLSILMGVSVLKTLKKYILSSLSLKWPNDVYYQDNKICGILLEGSLPNYVVVGIGINVNQIEFRGLNATSLKTILNKEIKIQKLYKKLIKQIKKDLKSFKNGSHSHLFIFNEHDYLKGKEISFDHNGKREKGIALKLNFDCSYNIKIGNQTIDVSSGEITNIK